MDEWLKTQLPLKSEWVCVCVCVCVWHEAQRRNINGIQATLTIKPSDMS